MTVTQDISKQIGFLSNLGIMIVGAECGFRDRVAKGLIDELRNSGTAVTSRFQTNASVHEAKKALADHRCYVVMIGSADSADPEMLTEHIRRFREAGVENLAGIFIDPPISEEMEDDLAINVREFLHDNSPLQFDGVQLDYRFLIDASGPSAD